MEAVEDGVSGDGKKEPKPIECEVWDGNGNGEQSQEGRGLAGVAGGESGVGGQDAEVGAPTPGQVPVTIACPCPCNG